ncbi:hypothetical protein Hanom_Chr16g01518981 [Helianthus anomalus]
MQSIACYSGSIALLYRLASRGVSPEAASLFLRGRGKAVYILPSSYPTFALLLVGFTEYDDDDDDSTAIERLADIRTHSGPNSSPAISSAKSRYWTAILKPI